MTSCTSPTVVRLLVQEKLWSCSNRVTKSSPSVRSCVERGARACGKCCDYLCSHATQVSFCLIVYLHALINTGITVNDTVVGDPLMTVPIRVPGYQTDLHLCYEIHGTADTYFNFVSDDCTSVNAHYVQAPGAEKFVPTNVVSASQSPTVPTTH